jgi:hypothetical protein
MTRQRGHIDPEKWARHYEEQNLSFWQGLSARSSVTATPWIHDHRGLSMRELNRVCRSCFEKRLAYLIRKCRHGTVEEISAARLANDLNPNPYRAFIENAGYTWKGGEATEETKGNA